MRTRLFSVAAVAILVTLLFSACTPSGAVQTVIVGGTPMVVTATPEVLNLTSPDATTFTNVSYGDPETLDPALAYETAGGEGIGNVYETLIYYKGEAADPAALKAACESVTSGIVADDAAGTLTVTLAQPFAPFQSIIAQTWGSVMDKEWVMENGGWDGSCDTWQNYYGVLAENDPFTSIMNGTGPFKLDHWTPGEEVVLVRNDDYWRTEPAYEGGPSGPAALERVVLQNVEEWGTRFA